MRLIAEGGGVVPCLRARCSFSVSEAQALARRAPVCVGARVPLQVSPGSQRRAVGQGKTDVVRVLAESGQVAVNHAGAGDASALRRAALNGDAVCTRLLSAG